MAEENVIDDRIDSGDFGGMRNQESHGDLEKKRQGRSSDTSTLPKLHRHCQKCSVEP